MAVARVGMGLVRKGCSGWAGRGDGTGSGNGSSPLLCKGRRGRIAGHPTPHELHSVARYAAVSGTLGLTDGSLCLRESFDSPLSGDSCC